MNEEILESIRRLTNVSGVIVSLRVEDDRYYIDFDGRHSYKSLSSWATYWNGFSTYIKQICMMALIPYKEIICEDREYTGTVYIGTLFELLSRPSTCQN